VVLKRLRAGEWLAAAGGVALIAALLLPWYEIGGVDPGHDLRYPEATGFEALTVIDLLLAATAVLAIALAVLQATQDAPAKPVAAGVLTVTFGAIGVLLVLFRLIDQPSVEFVEVRFGAWIALVATVALTAGGWLSIAAERVRGLPPGLEPELRPSPRIADRAQP
jgi:hypothetical protein